jgi:hypothetical protein
MKARMAHLVEVLGAAYPTGAAAAQRHAPTAEPRATS